MYYLYTKRAESEAFINYIYPQPPKMAAKLKQVCHIRDLPLLIKTYQIMALFERDNLLDRLLILNRRLHVTLHINHRLQ